MGDDDQLGLAGLNERGDMVQSVFNKHGLLASLDILVLGGGASGREETSLLLLLGFGLVSSQQFEDVGSCKEKTDNQQQE